MDVFTYSIIYNFIIDYSGLILAIPMIILVGITIYEIKKSSSDYQALNYFICGIISMTILFLVVYSFPYLLVEHTYEYNCGYDDYPNVSIYKKTFISNPNMRSSDYNERFAYLYKCGWEDSRKANCNKIASKEMHSVYV